MSDIAKILNFLITIGTSFKILKKNTCYRYNNTINKNEKITILEIVFRDNKISYPYFLYLIPALYTINKLGRENKVSIVLNDNVELLDNIFIIYTTNIPKIKPLLLYGKQTTALYRKFRMYGITIKITLYLTTKDALELIDDLNKNISLNIKSYIPTMVKELNIKSFFGDQYLL